jgi:hypothetical protein
VLEPIESRFVVAPEYKFTDIGGRSGHMAGVTAGVLTDRSLYLGGAGMIWGLYRLGSNQDLGPAMAAALHRYRTVPAGEESTHTPSLLLGETGILAAAQKLGARVAGDRRDR